MAPSMQSITARNAKSGVRQPTMLTTGFAYSDDDSDGSDTVHCVVEPKPSMETCTFLRPLHEKITFKFQKSAIQSHGSL